MICPKCGFKQADAAECFKCGVIIKKFEAERQVGKAVDKALQEQEPEYKMLDVTIFSARYRIQGLIKIAVKGYRSRLSDFLNDDSFKFMAVVNAKISGINADLNIPFSEVVIINKNEIVMVVPD